MGLLCHSGFEISAHEIAPWQFEHPRAGAFASFEGRVRDLNEGQAVTGLEYEVYQAMALKEGRLIIAEAKTQFDLIHAYGVHRHGRLAIGEVALLVTTASMHRRAAFDGLEYIVDEIKARVPIWKKEHYVNAPAQWVACHTCASHNHHHNEHKP
jgi:molybdopterin synthase catalytic subunit